jgi:hypothetical protein
VTDTQVLAHGSVGLAARGAGRVERAVIG